MEKKNARKVEESKTTPLKRINVSKKSKRYLALIALLRGETEESVIKKYGRGAAWLARMIITTNLEAQRDVGKGKVSSMLKQISSGLIGCDVYRERLCELIKYGSKAIFIGGYHGLGKTSIVYEVAEMFGADVIRLQITELLTEIDIIGGLDIKSGKFIYSEFVQKVLEAKEHPEKQYFLLLDEFTRGRDEALNILFPVLAEKTLFINSPYADNKQIVLPDNIRVFGTGNINDKGIREVGEAEFDRWNGIEIKPIMENNILTQMIKQRSNLQEGSAFNKILRIYALSWQYGKEARILPMSHRTLLEASRILAQRLSAGENEPDALRDTLEDTYFVSSQAILNPNYKTTYQQILREVM